MSRERGRTSILPGQVCRSPTPTLPDVNDRQAERHFLWRHYVEYETMWPIGSHLFLARDDLPRFFEWLFNNLAAVVHHDWRVGVESLDGAPSQAPLRRGRALAGPARHVRPRTGWRRRRS
ncbi:hypothetical protein HS125_10740 [bacterium]|nr:hypothetical protein [bacterium]